MRTQTPDLSLLDDAVSPKVLEAMRAIEIVLQHYGRTGDGRIDGSTPLRVHFRENAAGEAAW